MAPRQRRVFKVNRKTGWSFSTFLLLDIFFFLIIFSLHVFSSWYNQVILILCSNANFSYSSQQSSDCVESWRWLCEIERSVECTRTSCSTFFFLFEFESAFECTRERIERGSADRMREILSLKVLERGKKLEAFFLVEKFKFFLNVTEI